MTAHPIPNEADLVDLVLLNKRSGFKPIGAKQADAIEAALLAEPRDLEAIATRFNCRPQTIARIRAARGVLGRVAS